MDRFDQLHDEWLDAWIEDNLRHLYEVCADYVPWVDAGPSASTSHGEDDGSTTVQEKSSTVLPASLSPNCDSGVSPNCDSHRPAALSPNCDS